MTAERMLDYAAALDRLQTLFVSKKIKWTVFLGESVKKADANTKHKSSLTNATEEDSQRSPYFPPSNT